MQKVQHPSKPRELFNDSNIPEALKKLSNWCLWNRDKVPFRADGKPLSSTKREDWCTFDAATSALKQSVGMVGIGFVFALDAGFIGIDLDHALKDDGSLKDWALKILSLFGKAYVEFSPSGKGFHIIVRGKKPGPRCRKVILSKSGSVLGELEMYDSSRYFTMTGNVFDSFSDIGEAPEQEAIDLIYSKVLAPGEENERREPIKEPVSEPSEVVAPPAPLVKENNVPDISTIISNSSQGVKFKDLVSGSLESYGGDQSRAVYALTGIVAFYTADFAQMDAIFRGSGLFTAKWAPDSEAGGAKAAGKWARLGEAQFRRQRAEYEAKGNVYDPGVGRTDPLEDFSDAAVQAERQKGTVEFERHIDVLFDNCTDVRRDLLSGSLHYKDVDGRWAPVFSRSTVCALRGECQARGRKLKPAKLENYLYMHEKNLPKSLLVDVPTWDKEDRISHMGGLFRFVEPMITAELFVDILKDWCARAWQKIERPETTQNRCLILSGAQGIGKDVWIQSMFCGLGHYLADLTLAGSQTKETEVAITMSQSIVMFISEFDKTKCLGVEVLKDLITKPIFTAVRKYDRDATQAFNRCSVIAAANPEHILRDVTGNRRFLVFKLQGAPGEAIRWEYPTFNKAFSLQILAQMRELAAQDYRSSREHEAVLAKLIGEYTPEDPMQELVQDFEAAIERRAASDPLTGGEGLFTLTELEDVLTGLSKNFSLPRRTVLVSLKAAGCQYRTKTTRLYGSRTSVNAKKEEPPF